MRDDSELVQQAIAGNQDAFAELYERYFERVYDFLARMVRNQQQAADLTQDTFLRALHSLPSLKQGASFKSWIFTIARNTALNQLERSSRQQPLDTTDDDDEGFALDVVDTDRAGNPEEAMEMQGLAGLVWEAAKALDPKQYSVLDLTVRQGLESAEIAEVLGVTKNNAYVMVNRMKKTLEDAIGTLMLLKDGRRGCSELNQILTAMGMPEMSPTTRRAIDRHAAKCDVCGERRRKMASPFAIMGGFAAASPGIGVKARILDGIQTTFPYGANGASGGGSGSSGGNGDGGASSASGSFSAPARATLGPKSGSDGFVVRQPKARRGLPKVLAGVAAVAMLLAGGLYVATASDEGGSTSTVTTQLVVSPQPPGVAALVNPFPATPTPAPLPVEPIQAVETTEPEVIAPVETPPPGPEPVTAGPTQPPLTNPTGGGGPTTPPGGGNNGGLILPPVVDPPVPPAPVVSPVAPVVDPPAPARCVVTMPTVPSGLTFASSETVKTIQIRATETCGSVQTLQVVPGSTWIDVTPSAASLQPGGLVTISVRIDRSNLAAGSYSGRIRVTTATGVQDIAITASVARVTTPPTLTPPKGQLTLPPTPTCRANQVRC